MKVKLFKIPKKYIDWQIVGGRIAVKRFYIRLPLSESYMYRIFKTKRIFVNMFLDDHNSIPPNFFKLRYDYAYISEMLAFRILSYEFEQKNILLWLDSETLNF